MFHELYKQSSALTLRGSLRHVGSGAAVVGLLIAGFWGGHLLAPRHSSDGAMEEGSVDTGAEPPTVVALPEEKEEAAGIHLTPVQVHDLQATKTVAATIDYDATRYLALKTPVDCVVKSLLVRPGQKVLSGDPLAVLSGSEVALARTEIQKCEADVRIAQINFEWTKETQNNLVELLSALKSQPPVTEIEAQFDGKPLGEHRDHLLTSYSKFMLAANVADRTKPLSEQGIVAGRTAEERSSQRDVAWASLKTAYEQSEYEGRRDLAKSEAELDLARQQLAVCQERLRLLLGPFADESQCDDPSDFTLRAPFEGSIEALNIAAASRVGEGEPVMVLADTTRLWVSALVHQHDWEALQLTSVHTVRVKVPAIPGEEFSARASFVGPKISPTTRAISLVAELGNADGRFRPGMFAWVALPMESPRQGVAVPTAAIQRHESETFVFVQEAPRTYRRVNVTVGLEEPEYVEVVQGLSAGQLVVDQGAFYLKSELLLEQEEE